MLSCSNIKKSYGDKEIVRGVSAQFKPGTISAIIGPSGTGKSTFLRVLSLLEPADSGSIHVDGSDVLYPLVGGAKPVRPWPRLTTVFQQLFLWPHLTIRQNICLPVKNTDRASPGGMVDQIMRELLVTEFADRYPNQVSHGQRQRAAIARAIALKPDFLLLDEITSALDVEHVGIVLSYLQRLRDEGVAIVLITHLIGFARDAADQVIFMEDGCIVESGPAKILSQPQTKRLADFLTLIVRKSVKSRVISSGVIRASYASYPPYYIRRSSMGEAGGIFFEILNEIGKRLGLRVEWVEEVAWANVHEGLNSGHYDIFGSGIWPNNARGKALDFSAALFRNPIKVYGRSDELRFRELSSVNAEGVRVSCMDGAMEELIANLRFPKATKVPVSPLDSWSNVLQTIVNNSADVTFSGPTAVNSFLRDRPGTLKDLFPAEPIVVLDNAFAIRQGEPEFMALINGAIEELLNDGTVEGILMKYEETPGEFNRVGFGLPIGFSKPASQS